MGRCLLEFTLALSQFSWNLIWLWMSVYTHPVQYCGHWPYVLLSTRNMAELKCFIRYTLDFKALVWVKNVKYIINNVIPVLHWNVISMHWIQQNLLLKFISLFFFFWPATYSSTLAWKIPWMEESGRLESMGSQRVGHNWVTSPNVAVRKAI